MERLDIPLGLSLHFREELMDAFDFVLQLNPVQGQPVEAERALHGAYDAYIVQQTLDLLLPARKLTAQLL